jgi:peptide/nickel transport system ATP-binding protein
MSLLVVEDLRVGFGASPVVQGVGFRMEAGETLALVGESGCGKSMTAFALMQLLAPGATIQGGSVRLLGQEMVGASPAKLRDMRGRTMGLILQEPMTALNPVRTVGSQVAEAIRRHMRLSRAQVRARVLDLLDLVGIPDPAGRAASYPHMFSGGMRQRVMIAIAVACNPSLLIADEPTTALDVTIQAQVLELLGRLQKQMGMGLLLITHDLGVVADWADRVAVMYAGRIVEQGPAAQVLGAPAHPYTAGLLGASVGQSHYTTTRLKEIPGSVASAFGAPGCPFAPRCDRRVVACEAAVPLLHAVVPAHDAACIRA